MNRLLLLSALVVSQWASAQSPDCQIGWKSFQAKSYMRASSELTRCLAGNLPVEARATVLQMRAQSYFELKRIDLAIEDQKASLQLAQPRDVWPNVMLGAYYRAAKNYEASIKALQEAMKYDEDGLGTGPGMAVHYHLAQTLHAAGQYKEAIEVITKGIPKQPDYGYALYQRALSYEALGDRDQAKRDLFRASELTPKDGYVPEVAEKLREYGFTVKVQSE